MSRDEVRVRVAVNGLVAMLIVAGLAATGAMTWVWIVVAGSAVETALKVTWWLARRERAGTGGNRTGDAA